MESSKQLRIINKSGEDVMVNIQIEKSYALKIDNKIEASLEGGFSGATAKVSGSYSKSMELEWKKVDPGFFSVAKGQISYHSVENGSNQCYVSVCRKGYTYGNFCVTSVKGVYSSLIIQKKCSC